MSCNVNLTGNGPVSEEDCIDAGGSIDYGPPPGLTYTEKLNLIDQQVEYCTDHPFSPDCNQHPYLAQYCASHPDGCPFTPQGENKSEDTDVFQQFWDFSYPPFSIIEDAINYSKPIYKQVKYALPTGGLEALVDGGLQLVADLDNKDLNIYQRVFRATVISAETYFTDLTSDLGGAIAAGTGEMAFPAGGGIPGYFIGAYSTSAIIGNYFEQRNAVWIPELGLGTYP